LYAFDQYGDYTVELDGSVDDIYGSAYRISGTYDFTVARILDVDPAELPAVPYIVGDWFAPGLHVFPAVPAEVEVRLTHTPSSVLERAVIRTVKGTANRYGIFSTDEAIEFSQPGEYRVDITARYLAPDGVLWAGTMSWGSVVASANSPIEAHGRRGMDYNGLRIDDMPAWFETFDLPSSKVGMEMYYPYFSGDVHWGNEDRAPGDSIQPMITLKDNTPNGRFYKILRQHWPDNKTRMRQPPAPCEPGDAACLEKRIAIGEAPLFIATSDGSDPVGFPDKIDLWAYWYASSERPDVRVREVVSVDGLGTGYWRFDDTYGYQIGEGALGDLPGDLKWEFGGAVLREPMSGTAEYAAYASLWVLLPHGDRIGARVTPPFQDATGASLNGGPIMTLLGKEVDMLFLPKGLRPGDILTLGDAVAFSGHVGPPLDSRVDVTITSPSGIERKRSLRANQVGWVFDPRFVFPADEPGRWAVAVEVEHDRPYVGNGVTPPSHNTGTVLGTDGSYYFYVVGKTSELLTLASPAPGRLGWPPGRAGAVNRVQPVTFRGLAPAGAEEIYVTVLDKGVVMAQRTLTPAADGAFAYTYDAKAMNRSFPFVSLTAHEGMWEGLADEVTISFLATGGKEPQAALIHLIGEEVSIVADSL
jgi:hypothetical protein